MLNSGTIFLALLVVSAMAATPSVTMTEQLARDRRIVRGEPATRGEHAYMASLQGPTGLFCDSLGICQWEHLCGGTLIARNWVLTAASCLNRAGFEFHLKVSDLRVVLGATDLKDASNEHHQIIKLKDIIVHSEFDVKSDGSMINDIALLKLDHDAEITQLTQVATLSTKKFDYFNVEEKCYAMGWGKHLWIRRRREPEMVKTTYLQKAQMLVAENAYCKKHFNYKKVTEEDVCAQGEPVGRATSDIVGDIPDKAISCDGDAGGPLVCGNKVKAIASRGMCYEKEPHYNVYTRVSAYKNWINQKTKLQIVD